MSETLTATGRRKNAVARVRMTPGTGRITVNRRPFEDYFQTISLQNSVVFALQVANATQKFDVDVTANGGGAHRPDSYK